MASKHDDRTLDALTSGPTLGVGTFPPPPVALRFAPGSIVAGRYRLVSLLGRGGMGEVYRADDLTLDHPVALKFLPEGVAADDTRLAQFHNELRVARQVSHRNVCRLYDLGDADGHRFLTMEYVDGEDLASSLRRFGRMPPDKAIEIARQLCAGVAAAHERGVIHRDLKPANVMLDGNGDVRITDFGIATAAADAGTELAGTPQYLAPELLAGKAASAKSDIYALGLILFEVFTGKRAYEAKTIGELRHLQEMQAVTTPSSIVRDLDPAIERAILRCLEKDPEKRPASALTIAASLPGADPIAAALAAGETPSPELLVAAGESEAMAVREALALAIGFVVILLLSIGPIIRGSVVGVAPMPIARDALADRAEQTIRKLGYTEPIADRAVGLGANVDYLRWAQRTGSNEWWNEVRVGRPSPIVFWYRTSPTELIPANAANGRVDSNDPPMNVAGMHQVSLDANGRVLEFHTVPAEKPATSTQATSAPRWEDAFEAVDLDPGAFTPVTPQWIPRDFADSRAAWEGPMPGRANQRIRVEAAALRGRLVSFRVIWPWTEPSRPEESPKSALQKATDALSIALWITFIFVGVLLARHNLRLNRADRRGASRFGIFMTLASLAARLVSATHSTDPGVEMTSQIFAGLAFASFTGGMAWVFYLAIEPYGRRFWPDALLAWTRLWSGRLRDPRVGRELLIGMAFGALSLMVVEVPKLLSNAMGWRMPQFLFGTELWVLADVASLLTLWINLLIAGLQASLVISMIFLVLRFLLRRPPLALAAGVIVLLLAMNNGQIISGTWIDRFNVVAFTTLVTFVIHRYGLLAAAMLLFVDNIVTNVPLTTDLSVWWSTPTLLTVSLLIGLVSFAYYAARAGEPLFGNVLTDP
jgi:serine/threonine-protein kinase